MNESSPSPPKKEIMKNEMEMFSSYHNNSQEELHPGIDIHILQ